LLIKIFLHDGVPVNYSVLFYLALRIGHIPS